VDGVGPESGTVEVIVNPKLVYCCLAGVIVTALSRVASVLDYYASFPLRDSVLFLSPVVSVSPSTGG
jgi:hypothetical protein